MTVDPKHDDADLEIHVSKDLNPSRRLWKLRFYRAPAVYIAPFSKGGQEQNYDTSTQKLLGCT